jgi:hypothetical protein
MSGDEYEISDTELREASIRAMWKSRDVLWNFHPRCPICNEEWHGLPIPGCRGEYNR